MANDINKEDPHYKGEYGSIYEVNRKFPTGGVAGDFVVIEGWAHYWNAVRGTWCVNAERDSYWDELITNIIEKFKLVRGGATYMGVASLDTVPTKVIGAKMYYFATVAGTYKNFDNLVVPQGINVLYSDNGSSWVNTTLLEVAQELGVSTNKVVSQKTLNDALAKKFDKESVAQDSGNSEELVMSQKVVSAKLNDFNLKLKEIDYVNLILKSNTQREDIELINHRANGEPYKVIANSGIPVIANSWQVNEPINAKKGDIFFIEAKVPNTSYPIIVTEIKGTYTAQVHAEDISIHQYYFFVKEDCNIIFQTTYKTDVVCGRIFDSTRIVDLENKKKELSEKVEKNIEDVSLLKNTVNNYSKVIYNTENLPFLESADKIYLLNNKLYVWNVDDKNYKVYVLRVNKGVLYRIIGKNANELSQNTFANTTIIGFTETEPTKLAQGTIFTGLNIIKSVKRGVVWDNFDIEYIPQADGYLIIQQVDNEYSVNVYYNSNSTPIINTTNTTTSQSYIGNDDSEQMDADYNLILSYGQSLSVGMGYLTEDITIKEGCYMIGNNFHGIPTGDTLNKLIITSHPTTNRPVPPVCSCINSLRNLSVLSGNPKSFVCHSAGYEGYTLAQLMPTTLATEYGLTGISTVNPYDTQLIAALTKAKQAADSEDKSIKCPAILWMQGESDYGNNTGIADTNTSKCSCNGNKDEYKKRLKVLFDKITSDVKSILGQQANPTFYLGQIGGTFVKGDASINIAIMEYAQENENCVLLPPQYQLPNIATSNAHLTGNGYLWYGELCAKVIYLNKLRNVEYKPMRISTINHVGSMLFIGVLGGISPLVINLWTNESVDSYGFYIERDGKEIGIKSIVANGTTIQIELSDVVIPGSYKICYATKERNGSGNISDSDGFLSLLRSIPEADGQPMYYPKLKNGEKIDRHKYNLSNYLATEIVDYTVL